MQKENLTHKVTQHLLLLFAIGFSSSHCMAQDFYADMKKMRQANANITNLYMKAKIEFFSSNASVAPFKTEYAEVKMYGANYYTNIQQTEVLQTKDYIIMANNREKNLLVTPNYGKQKTKKGNLDILGQDTDSIINKYAGKIEYLGEKDGLFKHYYIYLKTNDIKAIEYFINKDTWGLDKVTYYYDINDYSSIAKIVVQIMSFNTNPRFLPDEFATGKYIKQLSKDRFEPAGLYKTYKLIYNNYKDKHFLDR